MTRKKTINRNGKTPYLNPGLSCFILDIQENFCFSTNTSSIPSLEESEDDEFNWIP